LLPQARPADAAAGFFVGGYIVVTYMAGCRAAAGPQAPFTDAD
jgi:hypothetical protein